MPGDDAVVADTLKKDGIRSAGLAVVSSRLRSAAVGINESELMLLMLAVVLDWDWGGIGLDLEWTEIGGGTCVVGERDVWCSSACQSV